MQAERRYCALRHEGRSISGVVMRYGDVANLGGLRERFEPGAFAPIRESVYLDLSHDSKRVLARNGGGGLEMEDTSEALTIRAELPHTRDADDALEMVRKKVLRGLSIEFFPEREKISAGIRVVEKADLRAVGVVAAPAYPASKLRGEVRENGDGIEGAFFYDRPRTISDRAEARASRRKVSVAPGAFRHGLQEMDREVNLILGGYERPLASRQAGSLELDDTEEALKFRAEQLPDTSYVRDLRASMPFVAYGVTAFYKVPPADVVPGATELIPEDGNPAVLIEVIREAVLQSLVLVTRPPRGNPGEVARRGSDGGEIKRPWAKRRRRVYL